MATSTEVTFQQTVSDTAKTTTIEVTSDFVGSNITWEANVNRGIVKIVDPNGNTHYNNTNVSSPDITASTKIITGISTDNLTIASHGYATGQPVTFEANTITGLNDNQTYFIIVVDSNTVQLATTYVNAIAGTEVTGLGGAASSTDTLTYNGCSLALPTDSDNEILQGDYTVTVTMFDVGATGTTVERAQTFNYVYDSPEVSFTDDYSVINTPFLKSVDSTNYTFDSVTPTMSGTMTLNYPDNLGTYVKTISAASTTLSTSGFYGGSPATHSVVLDNDIEYTITKAFYTDATGTLVPFYINDTLSGRTEINVYSNVSGCDLYCCLNNLLDRVMAAKGTQNYKNLWDKFVYASSLAEQIERSYECNKSANVNDIRSEFDRVTGCTGNCDDCGDDVTQVVGIGTVPAQTRKSVNTASSTITSATFSGLIGKSFTNGDFALIVDGGDVEFIGGYTITFDPITGTVNYGNSIFSGAKYGWRLLGN